MKNLILFFVLTIITLSLHSQTEQTYIPIRNKIKQSSV